MQVLERCFRGGPVADDGGAAVVSTPIANAALQGTANVRDDRLGHVTRLLWQEFAPVPERQLRFCERAQILDAGQLYGFHYRCIVSKRVEQS